MLKRLTKVLSMPAQWLRQWPQSGPRRCPEGYKVFYFPPTILAENGNDGSWQALESLGLVRMADDWCKKHTRPVAVPIGWRLEGVLTSRCLLRDSGGVQRAIVQEGWSRGLPTADGWVMVVRRFYTGHRYVGDYEMVGTVLDRDQGDAVVHETEMHRRREYDHNGGASAVTGAAMQWLDANHPGWRALDYGRAAAA